MERKRLMAHRVATKFLGHITQATRPAQRAQKNTKYFYAGCLVSIHVVLDKFTESQRLREYAQIVL